MSLVDVSPFVLQVSPSSFRCCECESPMDDIQTLDVQSGSEGSLVVCIVGSCFTCFIPNAKSLPEVVTPC